jgi:hypothetical protein
VASRRGRYPELLPCLDAVRGRRVGPARRGGRTRGRRVGPARCIGARCGGAGRVDAAERAGAASAPAAGRGVIVSATRRSARWRRERGRVGTPRDRRRRCTARRRGPSRWRPPLLGDLPAGVVVPEQITEEPGHSAIGRALQAGDDQPDEGTSSAATARSCLETCSSAAGNSTPVSVSTTPRRPPPGRVRPLYPRRGAWYTTAVAWPSQRSRAMPAGALRSAIRRCRRSRARDPSQASYSPCSTSTQHAHAG